MRLKVDPEDQQCQKTGGLTDVALSQNFKDNMESESSYS